MMVKVINYFGSLLLAFSLCLVLSVSPDRVNAAEILSFADTPVDGEKTKSEEKKASSEAKPDSTLIDEKMIDGKEKPTAEKPTKIENRNQTESSLSYNFVFYLMYKFKFDEIFQISKSNQEVNRIPDKTMLYERGKRLFHKLIQEFEL